MADDWEKDDYEPPSFAKKPAVGDRWEGEDEEDVKARIRLFLVAVALTFNCRMGYVCLSDGANHRRVARTSLGQWF